MTHYDSTARVPFAKGGKVDKKPKPKRIILWKGKVKDWPGAQKAKERTGKQDGGKIEKEKKWIARPGKRKPSGKRRTASGKSRINPEWLEKKYNVELKAKGGRIGRAALGGTEDRPGRHPPVKKEKTRKEKQADYIKKHGERPPRRKTLAVTDKYKKIRDSLGLKKGGKPWGSGPKPGTHEFLMQTIHKNKKAEGGIISLKKGGKADKKWIQKATKGMRKDKPCTGKKFGSASCPPGSKRYNLAQTFKKMARSKHASGGLVRYI